MSTQPRRSTLGVRLVWCKESPYSIPDKYPGGPATGVGELATTVGSGVGVNGLGIADGVAVGVLAMAVGVCVGVTGFGTTVGVVVGCGLESVGEERDAF